MTYRLEDAASYIFATGEPTADDLGETFQLSRALGLATCDSWTLDDLRAGFLLKALAEDHQTFTQANLAPYVETARTFAYQWPAGHVLAVHRLGSHITRAQVTTYCGAVVMVLHPANAVDFTKLSPLARQARPRFTIVKPSPDIEFLAQVAAA